MSMEIERLTAIIESQAVTIESLSQASRFDNSSMHSNDSNATLLGKNGNSGDGGGDHELVSEYRGIIYALNRERDELVRQVHTALQAVENREPQAALEKTFFRYAYIIYYVHVFNYHGIKHLIRELVCIAY